MKIIGYGVIVIAVALGVAAALAATWFFLVGGILDLADGRTISGGLSRIDEWNREYADRWGRTRLGLLKVFVLEPIALVVIALAVRALVSLGRRLAGSTGRSAVLEPAVIASPPVSAEPELRDPEPERALAVEAWDHPADWDVPPLPMALTPFSPEDELPATVEAMLLPDIEPEPVEEPAPEPVAEDMYASGLGETISLRALSGGGTIEATIRGVIDPVGGNPAELRVERYVAVLLEVHNPGDGNFEDMPTGGAFVIGSDDNTYRTGAQKMEPALREIRLGPGERCEGYLSFKLPGGIRATGFRFTPNLGLAPDTGEWALRDPAELR